LWRWIAAELDKYIESWRVQYIGVGRPPGALAPKVLPWPPGLPLVPWPRNSPYGLGLILTQEVARQPLRLILLQFDNTPRSHNTVTADVETRSKLIRQCGEESLHEDVGELRCHQDMEDADLTDDNLLSDKMKINLHMLGALMLNGVGG
jgi:hypothetical protein